MMWRIMVLPQMPSWTSAGATHYAAEFAVLVQRALQLLGDGVRITSDAICGENPKLSQVQYLFSQR